MRALVFVLLVIVVLLVGLGFYREWFHIGTTSNPEAGKTGIQVTIDQDKVKSDVERAKQQVSPVKTQVEDR
jgi:hypothetical protein